MSDLITTGYAIATEHGVHYSDVARIDVVGKSLVISLRPVTIRKYDFTEIVYTIEQMKEEIPC